MLYTVCSIEQSLNFLICPLFPVKGSKFLNLHLWLRNCVWFHRDVIEVYELVILSFCATLISWFLHGPLALNIFISKWTTEVPDKLVSPFLFFFLTLQELIRCLSVKPGSFSARTDGASRPCGDVMMMMIARTAATKRTVVSSWEIVKRMDKHNYAFAFSPWSFHIPAIMYVTKGFLTKDKDLWKHRICSFLHVCRLSFDFILRWHLTGFQCMLQIAEYIHVLPFEQSELYSEWAPYHFAWGPSWISL